jgi:uncharacterized protein YjeT (DUF2065 family)
MSNLIVALGLVLVIEGTLWALAPGLGRKLLQVVAEAPESNLRLVGAAAVALGALVIWLVHG